ncbi:MAG: hypothetical protein KDB27_34875, partial [Planctomycetales bacterium]|nr:hypothetical protein [Planctomycetales bacterium]
DADVRSTGPGNVVLIQLDYECVSAVFTGFGKIGRRAEAVADGALHEAVTFIDGNAPLNEYLADQLLLPMAVAAASNGRHSRFVTAMLSSHAKTHVDVIQRFLNVSVDVVPSPNRFEISVSA